MKQYRVKAEFVDKWFGGNAYNDEPIDEAEIESLAREWGMTVEELAEQVEEVRA